ncbi:MAG: L-rhamnose mutarotase [Terriglobales bacterium]
MKRITVATLTVAIVCAIALFAKSQASHVQRIAMVIGIKPDKISAYEALHAASNPGVRDLLTKYHMHNFSIFIHQIDEGKYYLFGYYEYTGTDYKADMAKLSAEPRNQQWLSTTDPLQIPLSGEKSWAMMQEVYHNP